MLKTEPSTSWSRVSTRARSPWATASRRGLLHQAVEEGAIVGMAAALGQQAGAHPLEQVQVGPVFRPEMLLELLAHLARPGPGRRRRC